MAVEVSHEVDLWLAYAEAMVPCRPSDNWIGKQPMYMAAHLTRALCQSLAELTEAVRQSQATWRTETVTWVLGRHRSPVLDYHGRGL